MKENSEGIKCHVISTGEVDLNGLVDGNLTDKEQDSFITLQPGKQWRKSLLIHKRNRRSVLNAKSEGEFRSAHISRNF